MQFEFATATRIIFGPGTFRDLGAIARQMGSRALVATGLPADLTMPLLEMLQAGGIDCQSFPVTDEPTTHLVQEGTQLARDGARDLVVGFGGGSAVDTGKAIAALLTNGGEPLDYLEVIGRGQGLRQPPAPYIAVPTSAGTGAEVTRNAVLASPEHQVKVSLRSPLMLPRLALIDPELTHSLPPAVTASTGLDALTQVLEPYVSHRANPLTDSLCREGMARAARSLLRAYQDGTDAAARQDMSIVSLFGGLALANSGLGAAHGFASPVGGMFHAPHGAVCAALLPHVMEANVRALQERQPDNPALQRYDEVARILTGREDATAATGVTWVQELSQALNVPPLSAYGMSPDDIPLLVEKSAVASSMKANPIKLTMDELSGILSKAM
jgi:alcohol dehydrogenase class IV